MVVRGLPLVVAILGAAACTPRAAPKTAGEVVAPAVAESPSGEAVDLRAQVAKAPFTVVTFFSAHCPCQRAHDERMREMYATYAPRGVQFLAIDAEVGASRERALDEAKQRGYPYPIFYDPTGKTIDVFGADYATYTVVVDRDDRVRYGGGIDSDKQHLTPDRKNFLKDALEDLTEGREPRVTRGKTLGCALERP